MSNGDEVRPGRERRRSADRYSGGRLRQRQDDDRKGPRRTTRLGIRGRRRPPSGIGHHQDAAPDIRSTTATGGPGLKRSRTGSTAGGKPAESGVITCSALKRSYRDFLVRGRPDVRLLYLHGDIELITARLTARKGQFMPASLLDSQLAQRWRSPIPTRIRSTRTWVGRSRTSLPTSYANSIRSCADRWIARPDAERAGIQGLQSESASVAEPNGAMETPEDPTCRLPSRIMH